MFHRVIPGFMIQGGGYDWKLNEKPTLPAIRNEAANGCKNERGTLALARTSDVDSATAQFFINLVDNDFLNHVAPNAMQFGYAVFGKVIEGMEVVDAIATVPTRPQGMHEAVPTDRILIKSAVEM
jgi:cyclophilin family peptidyl-prolyl cis-trans isomerase